MDLLTISEAATRLRLGRSTVYGMAQRNELPVIRFATRVLVPADELERWLRAQTEPVVASERNVAEPAPKSAAAK
jgi:excisionase family DNA binding protein